MQKARQRYLEKRLIEGPWQITGIKRNDYAGAVVIPACDEENNLFRTLDSLVKNNGTLLENFLILVVINQPPEAEWQIKIANRRTLEQFTAAPLRQKLQLGWIDACSDGRELPTGGVGSARKLGFDLALTRLRSDIDPILIGLDADTLVDANYLEVISQHFAGAKAGAAVLPFSHQLADNESEQQAIDQYELYLRCYLLGLTLAGSPYAFHTIGSALACTSSAYVRCGGMNRRKAGEDFYFLQALAKTSGVENLYGTTVYPSARLSTRVPFGTGAAMVRLVNAQEEQLFYPLSAFELLGRWLHLVATSLELSGMALQSAASALDKDLGSFLHRQKLAETWDRLRNNHDQKEKLLQAFHIWFDSLKTQQLLKYLSRADQGGMTSASEAVPQFFQQINLESTGSIKSDLALLQRWQSSHRLTVR